ncbi:MAG: sugar transferase [Bdellovibrionaceae bacterium]|nr:sugar transferase [Pseudobdellovibrionaceae bacterium]
MVFKRIFDIFLSLLLFFCLFPLYFLVIIFVLIFLGSPILFKQKRPGLNGKLFTIYKFRTMSEKVDANGQMLPDSDRLNSFGILLRKLSLDELPQLYNVLVGDMSFVGPRPLLVEYLERYSELQKKRHNMRPGITGLAQVSGRNDICWEDRLNYDVFYVENWSLYLDFKIIYHTIWIVLKRSGISEKGKLTMSRFMGTDREKL